MQAAFATVGKFDFLGQVVEIDQPQHVGQLDLAEQFFLLLLPGCLVELLAFQVQADLVYIRQPLGCQRLDFGGKQIVPARASGAARRLTANRARAD